MQKIGEASTVLQVALLAKQAFSRREPSSGLGAAVDCGMPVEAVALLSLLEVLGPRDKGHSTLLSLNREAAADDDAALLMSPCEEFSSAMTLLQLTHNARMRQANTPDLSAMAMPTPLS